MSIKTLIKKVAKLENISASFLEKQVKNNKAVILSNYKRNIPKPIAIGEGLKIKINTNIGTSTKKDDIEEELKKLKVAIENGTHTVMDLSVGKDLEKTRKMILKNSTVPVGTVPIYEAAVKCKERDGDFDKLTFDDIWEVLKKQAQEGVDFFTIHAGILKKSLDILKEEKRVCGIVSRGGAILARWMYVNNKENPLYENFKHILSLAKKYNITLSLGDALRPGSIADSTDKLQLFELNVISELVKLCIKNGVSAMVEGPGHIKINEVAFNVELEKKLCFGAPFYLLGPLVTDIAAGYDHISASIGASIAALYGADFLCVVTPAEHLRHPTVDDIKDGLIAFRIAAHSVDLLRFKDEFYKDYNLSIYRAKRDWKNMFENLIDKDRSKKYRGDIEDNLDLCSMCGDYCSLKVIENCNLL